MGGGGGGGGDTLGGGPSGVAATQKDRETAMMRQHRSGVRRFSVTSAPYLHPARSPSNGSQNVEMEYDEYGYEIGPKKPEHMQELQKRLQKMYSGIKSHTKAIKAAQHLTDEMAAGHYPGDEDEFALEQQQQFASRAPQQMGPPRLDYESTAQELRTAGVEPRSTLVWHKNKKKWDSYTFDFVFNLDDPGQVENVSFVLTNKKGETKFTHRFSHFSRAAQCPEEYEGHNQKETRKRNKKVRNKAELHLYPTGGQQMELVMLDNPRQRQAVQDAINNIIEELNRHHNKRMSMPPMPPPGPEDPQIAMDKAQNFMPSGAGLFDGAVVGEEATFDIEAKHPMDENNRPYDKEEMRALLPPEYDEYNELVHEGHGGGPHRLNVQLFSITQHEFDNGVGVSIDPDPEDAGESKVAGGAKALITAGGAGHQYDLRPIIMAVDANGDPVAEDDDEHEMYGGGYGDEGKTYHFQCKYTISRVGLYRVSIKLGNHHVYGSPYDLEGVPGAAYAKASVGYGRGLTQAHPYNMNEFVVEARDRLGNKRTEGGDVFFVEIDGPAAVCIPELTQAQKSAVATLAGLFEPNQNVLERTVNFLASGFEKADSGARIPIMSLPAVTGEDTIAAVSQAVAALPVDMDVIDQKDKTRDALAPVPQIFRMRVNRPAVDNGNGTYTVRYSVNNGELPSANPLKIRVKIDDGTMFNMSSVNLYKKNNDEMREHHRAHEMQDDSEFDPQQQYDPEHEPEDETDDFMDEITRPVYESRVNIVRSPFEVPISENTIMSAGGKGAETRPLASNDPGAEEAAKKSNSDKSGSGGALTFSKDAFHTDLMAGSANASSAALVAKRLELDRREAQIKQMEERLAAQSRALDNARRAAASLDQKQQQQQQQQRTFAAERLSTPSSNNFAAVDAGAKYSTKSDEPPARSKALVTPGPSQNSPAASSNTGPSVVSDEARGLLRRSRPALQSLFDTYSNNNLVTLKQFFRLCADFDLYPTFLTRAGVKKCFEKVAGAVSFGEVFWCFLVFVFVYCWGGGVHFVIFYLCGQTDIITNHKIAITPLKNEKTEKKNHLVCPR